jgi:nucleotide-binding universal stress UspA family protein
LEGEELSATVTLVQGRPAEQITSFAKRESADLIVLATHGDAGPQPWTLVAPCRR